MQATINHNDGTGYTHDELFELWLIVNGGLEALQRVIAAPTRTADYAKQRLLSLPALEAKEQRKKAEIEEAKRTYQALLDADLPTSERAVILAELGTFHKGHF
jgi:hypothetical protein